MPSAHRLAFPSNSIFTKQSKSGFTLVELLVVITIIAILSVIGVTVFTGIQKNARDTKRKGDVNAISKALEAKYSNIGAYGNLDVYNSSENSNLFQALSRKILKVGSILLLEMNPQVDLKYVLG